MKLSTLTAKLTWMKSTAVRAVAGTVLAGAALTAAAPAAQAQQIAFGVQMGQPQYYYAPVPHDSWRERAWREHEWREREARERYWNMRRHEEWEHARRGYYGDGYSNGYYGR